MQMKALRSPYLRKLSSNRSTSEGYCVTSMSAGTPGGYCLSQIRSMVCSSCRLPEAHRSVHYDCCISVGHGEFAERRRRLFAALRKKYSITASDLPLRGVLSEANSERKRPHAAVRRRSMESTYGSNRAMKPAARRSGFRFGVAGGAARCRLCSGLRLRLRRCSRLVGGRFWLRRGMLGAGVLARSGLGTSSRFGSRLVGIDDHRGTRLRTLRRGLVDAGFMTF